jgi:hypothetical protein
MEKLDHLKGLTIANVICDSWGGGLGLKVKELLDFDLSQVNSMLISTKKDGSNPFIVNKGKIYGEDEDWGRAYPWEQLDFVCEMQTVVPEIKLSFSLYQYLKTTNKKKTLLVNGKDQIISDKEVYIIEILK